jgi:hypothetical protein
MRYKRLERPGVAWFGLYMHRSWVAFARICDLPVGLLVILTFAVVVLTGCQSASQPVEPPPVVKKLAPGAARIVFFRPTNPPAAVKGILSLDGREVGRVFVRRYAILDVQPGTREVSFYFPGWAGTRRETIVLECQPNQRVFISYTSLMGVSTVTPIAPFVIYKVTPEMKVVSEAEAVPFLSRFEPAFVFEQSADGSKENQGIAPQR